MVWKPVALRLNDTATAARDLVPLQAIGSKAAVTIGIGCCYMLTVSTDYEGILFLAIHQRGFNLITASVWVLTWLYMGANPKPQHQLGFNLSPHHPSSSGSPDPPRHLLPSDIVLG